MKSYEEMTPQERRDTWRMYKNVCELAVTYEARTDPQVSKKRNDRVEQLYNRWIRYFTASDISAC